MLVISFLIHNDEGTKVPKTLKTTQLVLKSSHTALWHSRNPYYTQQYDYCGTEALQEPKRWFFFSSGSRCATFFVENRIQICCSVFCKKIFASIQHFMNQECTTAECVQLCMCALFWIKICKTYGYIHRVYMLITKLLEKMTKVEFSVPTKTSTAGHTKRFSVSINCPACLPKQ